KDGGVAARRARVLHRGRAAGEDDSPRRERAYLRGGKVGRLNFTINSQLADPPGNELGVLAAEVEDQNLLGVDVHRLVRCSHSTRGFGASSGMITSWTWLSFRPPGGTPVELPFSPRPPPFPAPRAPLSR